FCGGKEGGASLLCPLFFAGASLCTPLRSVGALGAGNSSSQISVSLGRNGAPSFLGSGAAAVSEAREENFSGRRGCSSSSKGGSAIGPSGRSSSSKKRDERGRGASSSG